MLQEFRKDSVVITDTSCFILLDKLDAFQILHKLYSNIVTTPEIALEFGKKLPEWILIKSVADKKLQYFYAEKVDMGEASAIALALELDSPFTCAFAKNIGRIR
jgi:predicted nucleic acid-binding protein